MRTEPRVHDLFFAEKFDRVLIFYQVSLGWVVGYGNSESPSLISLSDEIEWD